MLTRVLGLLHAHAAPPAAGFGSSRGHGRKKWIRYANRRKSVVHQDVFQFRAHFCGDAVGLAALGAGAQAAAEADGAVGEVEGAGAGEVRVAWREVLAAVLQRGLLLDDAVHQVRGAEARGRKKGKAVCSGLHLKFLKEKGKSDPAPEGAQRAWGTDTVHAHRTRSERDRGRIEEGREGT